MRDNRGLISLFYPEKKQQPNLNSWYYFIFLFHLRAFIILFFSFVQFLNWFINESRSRNLHIFGKRCSCYYKITEIWKTLTINIKSVTKGLKIGGRKSTNPGFWAEYTWNQGNQRHKKPSFAPILYETHIAYLRGQIPAKIYLIFSYSFFVLLQTISQAKTCKLADAQSG
jgi:hypothetical protein